MRSWGSDLHAWRAYMEAAALAVGTVRLRLYHLETMAAAIGLLPDEVTTDSLTEWLSSNDWGPNTIRSWRASLRSFYAWEVATGRLAVSPAALLPPVKVPRAKPRPTPEQAFRSALAGADDRLRLAMMLAGMCGLRRGEVARARREDLERDLLGWVIRVVGKGGHVRLVPLPDEVARTIRRRDRGWLFPSPRGDHLTPAHLGKLISAELPAGLTTHTLRHRCGTVSYAATRDLRAVQELLGHAKPETTAIYTEVPGSAIRAAMEGAA